MKLMTLTIAGVIAASAMTPTVAAAHPRHDRGWHGDRWDRGGRHWDDRRWDRGRRHWDNRRWDRGGRHWSDRRGWRGARIRTVCRWRPGPYGDVRVCQRVRG
jgi:hypothetical protein